MNGDGPYISVAALCDAVLDEKSGRLSCIRFLDRVDVELSGAEEALAELPAIAVQIWGLISMKSGSFKGKKMVSIVLIKPSGEDAAPVRNFPAVFQGGEHGINLILQFAIDTKEGGLYWFDILLDGERATRIPLKITVQRTAREQPQPESLTKA